jgi:hypothetical protein
MININDPSIIPGKNWGRLNKIGEDWAGLEKTEKD